MQKQITGIFSTLGLTASADDHRRVLAILAYLRTGPAGCIRTHPDPRGRPISECGGGWHRAFMHPITIPTSNDAAAPPAAVIPARDATRDVGALSAHEVVVAMEELSTR